MDEESSYLTTFETDYGHTKWNRLQFRLAVSSDIFYKKLMQALEGLKDTVCVADDILIYGIGDGDIEVERDHDKKVATILNRCAEIGIKLSKDKI